jgi:hypothetical protein
LRFQAGEWRCRQCGAALDGVGASTIPATLFVEKAGQPTIRIIEVEDVEIHRCEMREDPTLRPVDRSW